MIFQWTVFELFKRCGVRLHIIENTCVTVKRIFHLLYKHLKLQRAASVALYRGSMLGEGLDLVLDGVDFFLVFLELLSESL